MPRKMKDSGIEWIGEIPESWTKEKIIRIFHTIGSGTTPKSDNESFFDGSCHWIQSGDINGGVLNESKVCISDEALNRFSALKVYSAPFLVIAMYGASIGNMSISQIDGCVNQACCVLKDGEQDLNYSFYAIKMAKEYLIWRAVGGGQPNISQDTIKQLWLPMPSLSEQRRIATYLNAQCAKIDAVLEQTRNSIEEYKKLKQSVITQAVTKGIRPGRKMKDSGIEWIGEIPEEWDTPKILHCLQMPITDGPHTTPELFDEGIPFISAEAVSAGNGKIDFEHMRGYISSDFYDECCKKYIPQIDDIYMIKSGATTGRVAFVDTSATFTIWSPLAAFRSDKNVMLPLFLFYSLQSDYIQKQIENGWTYGTQQNIGMRTLEKMKICVPNTSEQNEIICHLNENTARIDEIIQKKQQFLTELESYKKSLIYECVTGKKEV